MPSLGEDKLLRSVLPWGCGTNDDELFNAASAMIARDDLKGQDNVIALWRLMQDIQQDRLERIEREAVHSIIIGVLPHQINGSTWRYAIGIAAAHGCLLRVSDERKTIKFIDRAHERDARWIKLCSREHPTPKIIRLDQ